MAVADFMLLLSGGPSSFENLMYHFQVSHMSSLEHAQGHRVTLVDAFPPCFRLRTMLVEGPRATFFHFAF